MRYVTGDILTLDGFKKGFVSFEHDGIVELEKGFPPEKPLAEGLIVPTLVNAHTHLGDSFIRKKGIELPRDVVKLVAPPYGLKHRLLKTASEDEVMDGMKHSVQEMVTFGISSFCDFREDGIKGIYQLRNAMSNYDIHSLILSRPGNMNYNKNEVNLLLENSDGIGLSSISDWELSEVEKIAQHTKQKNKLFALHASEVVREDIDFILDLKPDFLVHMIAAPDSDLFRVRDEGVPVVICPRSNAFFNLKAKFSLMKKAGIELILGTDNAMINTPNILEEIKYLKNTSNVFSTQELLAMVTYTPRKALNLDDCIHGLNSSCNFVVLDRESLRPLYICK
jgi:cytosine/adenosine deaminase-related metal-dependent hydrolase